MGRPEADPVIAFVSQAAWEDKVERLVAEGRMQPAGLREMERAKADGRWDAAYAAPRSS